MSYAIDVRATSDLTAEAVLQNLLHDKVSLLCIYTNKYKFKIPNLREKGPWQSAVFPLILGRNSCTDIKLNLSDLFIET